MWSAANQGSSSDVQCPGLSLGAHHVDASAWRITTYNHIVCPKSVVTVSPSFLLVVLGALLKSTFPAQTSAHTDFQGLVHTCMLSRVRLFGTPWTAARQAPLSMEFSKQEYWSVLPFPPPGDLSDPGIEPGSLASPAWVGRFLSLSQLGSPLCCTT